MQIVAHQLTSTGTVL